MPSTPATKRTRGHGRDSLSSIQSPSTSPTHTQIAKAIRLAPDSLANKGSSPLLCTLPPTCHPPHNAPSALANSQELELHYAKYHAHVCEERGCSAVFPNARLLELHQTECHDPLALIRKERGDKIVSLFSKMLPLDASYLITFTITIKSLPAILKHALNCSQPLRIVDFI